MRQLRQREPRLTIPALTRTARGEDCAFNVPGVCPLIPADPTVVWCHSNEEDHGKGKSLKAHDCFGAFGCVHCHNWYDRTRDPRRAEIFRKAKDRTMYRLFAKGALKVIG